jgi:hypothetical protein
VEVIMSASVIKKVLLFVASLTIVAIGIGLVLRYDFERRFPYGRSHCCDLQLMLSLEEYARNHGGSFPTGESTPEASLSLLYPKYIDADTLRGKTVPEDVVQRTLNSNGRLDPSTCGWHYVEGLTQSDDPRLAIFWDKEPLGHNGELNPDGGHWVHFVRGFGSREYVAGSRWEMFLAEQDALRKQAIAKRSNGE